MYVNVGLIPMLLNLLDVNTDKSEKTIDKFDNNLNRVISMHNLDTQLSPKAIAPKNAILEKKRREMEHISTDTESNDEECR